MPESTRTRSGASPPSEREAVALMRRTYRLLNELLAGDHSGVEAAFDGYLDEAVEIHLPEAYPEGPQQFRGRAGLERWAAATREAWDEWRFETEGFRPYGDSVVVLIRVVARGESSGVRLDRRTAHVWTVAGGRATSCRVYLERDDAFEAVRGGTRGPRPSAGSSS